MGKTVHHFDVAIVGASVAGATLAYALGCAGYSVCLLDKGTLPRNKACGEGIAPQGVYELRTLGLLSAVLDAPHSRFCGFSIHSSHQNWELKLAEVAAQGGIAIDRSELDRVLLSQALGTGMVTFFDKARVDRIEEFEDRVRLGSDHLSVSATYVALAEGVHSRLCDQLRIPLRASSVPRYGSRLHFVSENDPRSSLVHIELRPGFEIYATALGCGRVNVAVLACQAHIKDATTALLNGDLTGLLFERMGYTGDPTGGVAGAGPLGHRRTRAHARRTLLIGDTLETTDPIGGTGMTHALITARLGCNVLRDLLTSHVACAAAQFATYTYERERQARFLRASTRLTYYGLRSRLGRRVIRMSKRFIATQLAGSANSGVFADLPKRLISELAGR